MSDSEEILTGLWINGAGRDCFPEVPLVGFEEDFFGKTFFLSPTPNKERSPIVFYLRPGVVLSANVPGVGIMGALERAAEIAGWLCV